MAKKQSQDAAPADETIITVPADEQPPEVPEVKLSSDVPAAEDHPAGPDVPHPEYTDIAPKADALSKALLGDENDFWVEFGKLPVDQLDNVILEAQMRGAGDDLLRRMRDARSSRQHDALIASK